MNYLKLVAVIFISINCSAQKLEKVHSIVKEMHEQSWYTTQARLWEAETNKTPENGNAWYNYYSANRALQNLNWQNKKEYDKYYEKGAKIVDLALASAPNTFEANHIKWWHGGNKPEFFPYLEKAAKISPHDPRTFDDFISHFELKRKTDKRNEYCKKSFKANEYPSGLLNWGYNLLSELNENAIVLTVGDNDTYPLWVVQAQKGFREDVTVINTSLILVDDYRIKLFEELGMPSLSVTTEKPKSQEEYQQNKSRILRHILENNKRAVYVSVTAIHSFKEEFGDDLLLTGLAYKYSKTEIDNLSIIKRNYEKRYLLNHLTVSFSFNIANNICNQMDASYLPSMVKLYKHYRNSEETAKLKELERILFQLGERTGRMEEIKLSLKEKC